MNQIKRFLSRFDATQKSGFTNMFLKPISMVLSLVYTPMLLDYLKDEKYGIWVTILSIVNWVNYFDVGIGNGMRHLLAKELADEEYERAKKTVSTSYIVLTLISTAILLVLLFLTIFARWNVIFKTDVEVRPTLGISFVFICVNFVLSLNTTILYALQMSERVAVNNCLTQCINLGGLLLLRLFSEQRLEYVATLFGVSTLMVYIVNSVDIFKKYPYLTPERKEFRKSEIQGITGIGLRFFVIQIMCLMMFTVDNLLISHFWGATEVTSFSITDKIFNTAYTVLAAFLVPYWSKATVAFEKKDVLWIKKSLKYASLMCFLFVIGYYILSFVFRPLVALWMGKQLNISQELIAAMATFYSLYSVLSVECQFVNGSGRIGIQLILYIFAGVMNIPLSILIGVYWNLGPIGIRLATAMLVSIMDILLGINLKKIIGNIQNSTEVK